MYGILNFRSALKCSEKIRILHFHIHKVISLLKLYLISKIVNDFIKSKQLS